MRFLLRSSAALTLAVSLGIAASAAAQTSTPACSGSDVPMYLPGGAPSSPAEMSWTQFTKDRKTVTVYYSAPSVRCRKIFGGLVPFGEVWRTGANPATIIVSEVALKIGSLDVPAGTHAIYTLPAAPGKPWLLVVSNQVGQWGTEYAQANDLGRTEMKSAALSAPQELMSLTFENKKPTSAELHLRWDKLDEWVPVTLK